MANPQATLAGQMHVQTREASFQALVERMERLAAQGSCTVALSGGSTPKAFYTWVVAQAALSPRALQNIHWHVSDERWVPLSSEDSNFGQAQRGMLQPLKISAQLCHPWPVELSPADGAKNYNQVWQQTSPQKTYDLCLLGLGDDGHIASLWPHGPWLEKPEAPRFAETHWPGRGWRLTITETGLAQCGEIVVLVNGASKVNALREVTQGAWNPSLYPGQILRKMAAKVTWLVDAAAAGQS